MVKNKKLLSLSIVLFIIVIAFNFPFPNRYPSIEKTASILNVPIVTESGFHILGIVSIILFIISLFLLAKSLTKYQGRIIIATMLALNVVPLILVNGYQSTLATGVYAISYESEASRCEFDRVRKNTLSGECALHFKNHSNKQIEFLLEFQEHPRFKDDPPMIELMNTDAPYEITLSGNEERTIYIDTLIDVSNMENHIENGGAQGINIHIESNGKEREL